MFNNFAHNTLGRWGIWCTVITSGCDTSSALPPTRQHAQAATRMQSFLWRHEHAVLMSTACLNLPRTQFLIMRARLTSAYYALHTPASRHFLRQGAWDIDNKCQRKEAGGSHAGR